MSAWDDALKDAAPAPVRKSNLWEQTLAMPSQQAHADDPGALQTLLIGAGRTFDRLGKGAQQLYYGATGNHDAQRKLAEAAAEDDRIYSHLQQQRPFTTGIGEALPAMVMPAGGGATLGTTMAMQAAAGAAIPALSYGSLGERAQGAGWGAAAGAAVPALGAAVKTGYAAAEPLFKAGQDKIIGRALTRAAGLDAEMAMWRMQNASPLVAGSLPTVAQVAENGGLAALERSASAVNPAEYAQRAADQIGARRAALQGIAGTPNDLATAEAMRANASTPWYNQAKSVDLPVTKKLADLLDRMPASTQGRAERIAHVEGEPLGKQALQPQVINSSILGANGQPIQLGQVNGAPATMSGRGLHYLKLGLDDEANLAANSSARVGPAESNAIGGLQGDFKGFLNENLPGFQKANQIYADLSRPINQMQIGQHLHDKLAPGLADHGMQIGERAQAFGNLLRDDGLPARVTGFPGATWDNTLSPQQLATVNNVAQDLARTANAANLGKGGGSDTVQKLAMQNIAAQSGMPSAMGALTGVGSKALGLVYDDANQKMAQKLAQALLNPSEAAALMGNAGQGFMANSPTARNALAQALWRSSFALPAAGAQLQESLLPALTAE